MLCSCYGFYDVRKYKYFSRLQLAEVRHRYNFSGVGGIGSMNFAPSFLVKLCSVTMPGQAVSLHRLFNIVRKQTRNDCLA